jgi:hypothetical protein
MAKSPIQMEREKVRTMFVKISRRKRKSRSMEESIEEGVLSIEETGFFVLYANNIPSTKSKYVP